MTNKEAINIISQMIKDEEGFLSDNTVKAHKIAIKALEQEPCEMTAEEYRQRMIQAFHNADADGLIAVCVLPTEKEFKHLEWLLKNHYKKASCDDAVSRQAVKEQMIKYGFHAPDMTVTEFVKDLPPVTPTCEEREKESVHIMQDELISRQAAIDIVDSYSESQSNVEDVTQDIISDISALPPVTPQSKTGHWIPVSEELPDKEGHYLCSVRYMYPPYNFFEPEKVKYMDDVTIQKFDGEFNIEVKAWMPLPKPFETQERSGEG